MSAMDPHGIPWAQLIIPQAVNFSVFIGLLVHFLKKPLRNHFSGKNEQFEELRNKAEEARIQAERQNHEVRNQLKILEETSDKSFSEAKSNAQALREQMLAEAKESAEKMTREADKMAEFEYMRAVALLRQELVVAATDMAKENIGTNVSDKRKSKLNDEFVMKLQAAKT